jgi:hypothetical protein
MKYRIVETQQGFYPQEKKYLLWFWEYLDNLVPHITWSDNNNKYQSVVPTYDKALQIILNRKKYLKNKKFKKIHNL